MADAVKMAVDNTARFGGGMVMRLRWSEVEERILSPRPADTRGAEDIIADITERAGLVAR